MTRRRCSVMLLLLATALSREARAQQTADSSSFADLRSDGNGVAALRTMLTAGFVGQTAERAIAAVAQQAGLNVTMDPSLPNLGTVLSIPTHGRTAAAALLEIGAESRLRIRVSPRGQLVFLPVTDAPPRPRSASVDTARRGPVALPGLRVEATRTERVEFEARPSVGLTSMGGDALRSSPAFVEPDLLRSIQTLPGIEARSDWSAGFNVHGGEADQSLIQVDGYPIYNPFHLGGLFSTFIAPTVGRVELRTGALPVRYGGRLSGVLDVQSAVPTTSDAHGSVDVSLVSSTASVGRTFSQGDGAWTLAARRTYADKVVDVFKKDGFPYHFQDAQGHIATSVAGGVRLSATGYVGLDAAAGSDATDGAGTWGNSLIGATLSKRIWTGPHLFGRSIGDSITAEQRASRTRFTAELDVPDEGFDARNDVTDTRVAGTVTVHGAGTTTVLGYELARQHLSYVANSASTDVGDFIPLDTIAQRLFATTLFADRIWRPRPSLLVELGGRWEKIADAGWSGFSPRVSLKYFLHPDLAITAGGGRYVQWMHSLGREEEPIQPLQFWVGSDSLTPVSLARDAVLGVERWVTPTRLMHLEAFVKRYDAVVVPNPYNDPVKRGDEFTSATGHSYGVDFLLRELERGPFSGWLAYTLAFSSRVDAQGVRYAPTQDRRHNLNLVGSWRTNAYTFGARMNLASGIPYTPQIGRFHRLRYDPVTRRWEEDQATSDEQTLQGPFHSERLPWYDRIDVSVTRTGHLFGAPMSSYLSVLNVLNAKNPAAYIYQFGGQAARSTFPNLPLTPTFGVSVAF